MLIVDDDLEIGRYISAELGRYYKFGLCTNGKEGLKELLTNDYDLVVSDVMMPEMDGFTMLRMIKTNINISHMPVIMLTSKADVGNRLEGLERGADAFLAKPFDMEELHMNIENLIHNRQRLKGKYSGAQQQADKVEQPEVKGNDELLMERIMKAINKNLSNSDFNVDMLTQEVGISRAQLHRKMKEMTGISTSEFIRNIRLEQAARLLKEQKINVTQVAYTVGFSNLAHFSTIFRKHFGVSPSEYAEQVHATFENPSNTNTTWNSETKTFTWSTTYYNQLRNIGLPNGDLTKYKKLVVDCTIKSGDQFRILFYKGGSNLTLYAKDGVNEFILADTLKALYPNDYNEYLLACDEICLSGNNAAAPGEAVINDMYLETYDDEGEKVYASFENPSNTNTTWNAETKTFTWSTTYYNQLRNIGLPSGDITKYKKLVVDCEIKSGDQFRVLIYKGGSNLTLYAKNGVNEFILADTLKALYPNDYNEYLLACDEICLSGNNAAAPGEAVINAVYLETYPENESVEIPEIVYEEDPGKPEGEFVDFTEVFSTLQPRIGLGTDGHPIVLGNGDVVVGQRTKDIIADLSAYSKLTMVTSPNLKLVVYMNHEVDAQQNAGDYAEADAGKYVFLDVQADENGIIEVDLTQYDQARPELHLPALGQQQQGYCMVSAAHKNKKKKEKKKKRRERKRKKKHPAVGLQLSDCRHVPRSSGAGR